MATTSFKKKGGNYRAVILAAADADQFVVPAGFRITGIVTKKIGTVAGNLTIGTADEGAQIVDTVALGTVDGAIAVQTVLASIFSTTAAQTCFINISSATTCDMFVTMQQVI
jgi:hypothetical protein